MIKTFFRTLHLKSPMRQPEILECSNFYVNSQGKLFSWKVERCDIFGSEVQISHLIFLK